MARDVGRTYTADEVSCVESSEPQECKCGKQGIPVFGDRYGWADCEEDPVCTVCAGGWWTIGTSRRIDSAETGDEAKVAGKSIDERPNSFEHENERGRAPRGEAAPGSASTCDAARSEEGIAGRAVDQIVRRGRNALGRHAPSLAIGSSAPTGRCRTMRARASNSSGNRSRRCFSGCADVRFSGANPSSHTWRGGALDIAHVNTHRHIDTP